MKGIITFLAVSVLVGSVAYAQTWSGSGASPGTSSGSTMGRGGMAGSSGMGSGMGTQGSARSMTQTTEGTVQSFDPTSGQLVLDDGTTFTIPQSRNSGSTSGAGSMSGSGTSTSQMPGAGDAMSLRTGERVRITFFDQGGQKIVSSISPAERQGDTGGGAAK